MICLLEARTYVQGKIQYGGRVMKIAQFMLLGILLASAPSFAKDMQTRRVDILRVDQPSYVGKFDRGAAYTKHDVDDAKQQAKFGDLESQYNVGVMLVSRNRVTEAAYWYDQAARRGHNLAQYNLAVLYFNGEGVPRNFKRAAALLSSSAEKGNADAQYLLGRIYFTGQGVQRDFAKEAEWYQRAAEQGHALAQYNLGALYYLGEGVGQDKIEAYAWWSVAHQLGLDTSEAIEVLKNELTDAQIDEAISRQSRLFNGV
ncbi:MAG: tetratricopeptide repeat protein [Gammaproteobacteria bacterium]